VRELAAQRERAVGVGRERVVGDSINRELIAGLYHVADADILELVTFDPAAAIKITMRRPRAAGGIGETDVYGAQQHAPLLRQVIELPARRKEGDRPDPSRGRLDQRRVRDSAQLS
jgi:hypothetical protein